MTTSPASLAVPPASLTASVRLYVSRASWFGDRATLIFPLSLRPLTADTEKSPEPVPVSA